ncbi:MAG: hypothetical protein IJ057_06535 [Bacteroidales bacterium]|nr:hypothetical protein [Bacteroidales bacterium]
MKLTDFMIHDLVLYRCKPWKVIDLCSCSAFIPMTLGEDAFEKCSDNGTRHIGKNELALVEPMPIAPETYRAIGFSCHTDLDGVETWLHEDPECLCELQAYKEGNRWRFRIQRGPEAVVSIKAQYVHELQHAMRLMGLNDMADNFKVKEGGDQ